MKNYQTKSYGWGGDAYLNNALQTYATEAEAERARQAAENPDGWELVETKYGWVVVDNTETLKLTNSTKKELDEWFARGKLNIEKWIEGAMANEQQAS